MIDSTIAAYIKGKLVAAYSQGIADDAIITATSGALNDGEFTAKDVVTTETISFSVKISQAYASGPIDRVPFFRSFRRTEVDISGTLTDQRPVSFSRNNPIASEPYETTFVVEYKNKILEA